MRSSLHTASLALALSTSLLVACGDDTSGTGGGGGGTSTSTSSGGGSTSTTTSASGGGGVGGEGGAGEGGGTVETAVPECETDTDCFLSNDCCECAGRPNGQAVPDCAINCVQDKCQEFELPTDAAPVCRAGRCVAPTDCDQGEVVCDQIPPSCPAGTQPIVDLTTSCWQGGCQKTLECRKVSDCNACKDVFEAVCVTFEAQLSESYCVDVPAPCGDATCECLGPSVCSCPSC